LPFGVTLPELEITLGATHDAIVKTENKKNIACLIIPVFLLNKEMNFKWKKITMLMVKSINYLCHKFKCQNEQGF
jgi:hypothetical protein